MTTETREDWRSGAYGANGTAHLFTYAFSSRKHTVCGARVPVEHTASPVNPSSVRKCSECKRRNAA